MLTVQLVAFFPPMEEDKEYIKVEKEETKESKGKKSKKKNEKKQEEGKKEEEAKQFPLRTFRPDIDVIEHIQDFLVEYDFIVLLFLILTLTFTTSMIFKIFVPSDIQSNFIFYSLVILLTL